MEKGRFFQIFECQTVGLKNAPCFRMQQRDALQQNVGEHREDGSRKELTQEKAAPGESRAGLQEGLREDQICRTPQAAEHLERRFAYLTKTLRFKQC